LFAAKQLRLAPALDMDRLLDDERFDPAGMNFLSLGHEDAV
jgi:hypothetical protein